MLEYRSMENTVDRTYEIRIPIMGRSSGVFEILTLFSESILYAHARSKMNVPIVKRVSLLYSKNSVVVGKKKIGMRKARIAGKKFNTDW